MLLKSGYNYVSYSSLEAVIEDNKEAYYLALRKTQGTFKSSSPDYEPWIDFFTKALKKQKVRLEYKLEHIDDINKNINDLNDLPETAIKILELFNKENRITISYIRDNIEDSEGKIKRSLTLLQKKNLIKKYGVTNGCWYVKLS